MAACITVRPIEEPADLAFLFEVYAGTRLEELAVTGWSPSDTEAFLRRQFSAQHAYYREHYPDAELQIILAADRPAGRLYVNHGAEEIRVMDLALLPAYRGQGMGWAHRSSMRF